MQLKRRRHSLASRDCRRQVGGGNARKQWAKRRWSWELKLRKRAAECQAASPRLATTVKLLTVYTG